MMSRVRSLLFLMLVGLLLTHGEVSTPPVRAESTPEKQNCGTPFAANTIEPAPIATPGVLPFDLVLINSLIQHQAPTSTLANLALQRAQHSDVRRIALRIAESQAGEMQLLRTWRSTWYPDVAAQPLPPSTVSLDLPDLCASTDFDRAFLAAVIAQDQQGLLLAQSAISQIEHEALRTFVNSYIETTQSEIRSMQALLARLPAAAPSAG